ncbi:MAG: hypothetical protein E7410_02805, partial [Ruminococcaceae bacterium]|nr:hypothetical protein [Oscillospiraceae bacterium]
MKTKTKRIFALLMCFVMMTSMALVPVAAEETEAINVTLTVSMYGRLLDEATLVNVELSGKDDYTLDDVFRQAHLLYCETADGYASEGVGVKKFWGVESDFVGYQVNGGTESVYGLDFVVNDGDYIDAAIYQNAWPDTESYTAFDSYMIEAETDKEFELSLIQMELDENWQTVFLPCEGATVVVNDTEYLTDEQGKIALAFDEPGTYIATAKKTKFVGEQQVAAITAPVCKIVVEEPDYVTIMNNIAAKYSTEDIVSDGNMIWFIADMAVYNSIYPQKGLVLSDEIKQMCVDKILADCKDSSSPGVLAKSIIALRAMGYDASQTYGADLKKIDIVEKLSALVDEKSEEVTNMYTLPYVMIALNQKENYATDEQIGYLIEAAIAHKASWQYNEWGTDAATAMLLALAQYYNVNEDVKEVADETISLVKEAQDETGAIGNAASTGLAIVALSGFEADVSEVIYNEKSLIDGIMSYANSSLDGFEPMSNSFSTEQGFRGLLAWQMMKNNKGIMYDFSSYPAQPVSATWLPNGCPVVFNVTPGNAQITISGIDEADKNRYDIGEGTYSYTVTASGYTTETGVLEISAQDAAEHILKNISVSLQRYHSGGGGGGGGVSISPKPTVTENADGSTTITTTDSKTSTVTEKTQYPGGETKTVETKKDGTVTTTRTDAYGNTGETVTNPDGTTSVEATISKESASNSSENGTTIS